MSFRSIVFLVLPLAFCCRPAVGEVRISDSQYEGRDQFRVETSRATYWFDRAGGGFSRLLDRDGNDWIAFHQDPLKEFPESAAAGYRGIANLVFGSGNPDAGAGHPGFDRCSSELAGENRIRTTSHSGRWQWEWEFSDEFATLTILKVDRKHPYWFLYEGVVGGKWSPTTHYFGTSLGGPVRDRPDNRHQLFGRWQWAYFGDDVQPRVLLAVQRDGDQLDDTLWYLGSSAKGLESKDGMIVFGFGRGKGAKPLLHGAGEQFRIGFVDSKSGRNVAPPHREIARTAQSWIAAPSELDNNEHNNGGQR